LIDICVLFVSICKLNKKEKKKEKEGVIRYRRYETIRVASRSGDQLFSRGKTK